MSVPPKSQIPHAQTPILLVDDDPVFLGVLRSRLNGNGYQVACAANGLEAQDILKERHFAVVVTDILMPVFDGLQLIEVLRRSHPGTRIIAMTAGGALACAHYLNLAEQAGAHAALQKPFSRETLEATISRVLA